MRYENLKYQSSILPIIRRHDKRTKSLRNMYMHWHNAVEILLIMEGEMTIIGNEERTHAKAGQLVCIHDGQLHLYEPITEGCRYYCIIFPAEALDSSELYQNPLPRVTEDAEAIYWMNQLLPTVKAKEKFWQERGKAMLTLLYTRLTQLNGKEHYGEKDRPAELVKNAMDYIDKHFPQADLSLQSIADELSISPYHISHIFKKVTGQTISSYWQAQRCDFARRLLQSGANVAQAAEQAGFSSQSYFCRAYQKYFGILPSKHKE